MSWGYKRQNLIKNIAQFYLNVSVCQYSYAVRGLK